MILNVRKDATITEPNKRTIIAHVVNDIGAFGAGFSGALERAYPGTRLSYWDNIRGNKHLLGSVLITKTGNRNVCVAHLVAQHGVRSKDNPTPIKYHALKMCLQELSTIVVGYDVIQMPKIGSGLAGGDWSIIEPMIQQHLGNFNVVVCDYP